VLPHSGAARREFDLDGAVKMRFATFAAATMAALGSLAGAAGPAVAHPHVFVTTRAIVVYEKGTITAIDHVWTFDEFYTAMAIEGLDTNKDGKYSREELADLAKTNMEGLKDFNYFTYPKLGASDLKTGEPVSYFMEHKDGVLSLHFRLAMGSPILAEAKGFNFAVYDPSYFIGFDLAEKDPVTLGPGAPKGCVVEVGVPKEQAAEAQKLGESFFQQLGGNNVGFGLAKTALVKCS
jgi:ABC-type uncharacterized transport system substrate-binding protein